MADHGSTGILAMTTDIIANFVANNHVTPEDLPGLVTMVHGSLSRLGEASSIKPVSDKPERLTPTAVRKLITPQGITSLIDGRTFKSMRRHLSIQGYTPQSYREHFGLPSDFPIVSPEYAAERSALAKSSGLGQRGRQLKKTASAVKPAKKPRGSKG